MEVAKIAHNVKCFYCGKTFDRDKLEAVKIPNRNRFAHKECFEAAKQGQFKEQTEREAMENYLCQALNVEFISPFMQKQLNKYREEYNFTDSGLLKALKYWIEIKHETLNQDSLGILPYIYKQAYQYYYNIWMIQQLNAEKNIADYVPKIKKIVIKNPEIVQKKRSLFKFLDEEVENE